MVSIKIPGEGEVFVGFLAAVQHIHAELRGEALLRERRADLEVDVFRRGIAVVRDGSGPLDGVLRQRGVRKVYCTARLLLYERAAARELKVRAADDQFAAALHRDERGLPAECGHYSAPLLRASNGHGAYGQAAAALDDYRAGERDVQLAGIIAGALFRTVL